MHFIGSQKNWWSYRLLLFIIIANIYLPAISSPSQCRELFLFNSQNKYYSLGELEAQVTNIVTTPQSTKINPLPDTIVTRGFDADTIHFNKVDYRPPVTEDRIALSSNHSPRERLIQEWGSESLTLPLVKISKISDLFFKTEVNRSPDDFFADVQYKLAQLSTGQVVLISHDPLVLNKQDQPTYGNQLYLWKHMVDAKISPFVAVGKTIDNKFYTVLPLHNPYGSSSSVPPSNIKELFRVFRQTRLLEKLPIPYLNQRFNAEQLSQIEFFIEDAFRLGLMRGSLFVRGTSQIQRDSWEFEDILVAPVPASAGLPFTITSLYRALLVSETSPAVRLKIISRWLEQGHINDVLTAIYFDLVRSKWTPSSSKKVNWEQTTLRARIDEKSSLHVTGWLNSKSLKYHFKKHGNEEMKVSSPQDYEQAAIDFFASEESPSLIMYRPDTKSYFKYNFNTFEFAIANENGQIITYFQLNDQYRSRNEFESYIAEQLKKR